MCAVYIYEHIWDHQEFPVLKACAVPHLDFGSASLQDKRNRGQDHTQGPKGDTTAVKVICPKENHTQDKG